MFLFQDPESDPFETALAFEAYGSTGVGETTFADPLEIEVIRDWSPSELIIPIELQRRRPQFERLRYRQLLNQREQKLTSWAYGLMVAGALEIACAILIWLTLRGQP